MRLGDVSLWCLYRRIWRDDADDNVSERLLEMGKRFEQDQVLNLWFPNNGFWNARETFSAWVEERMYGGMDAIISDKFADLTLAAAKGELDHWTATAEGRIALIIALDQFSRSLWRDTPAAYAQDIKANRLVLDGIANGHVAALAPWKKIFCVIALAHCEGVDHLDRLAIADDLTAQIIHENPPQLTYTAELLRAQAARVRSNIETFGRHPHRNPHFGRASSPDEETYIARGDFPHVQKQKAS